MRNDRHVGKRSPGDRVTQVKGDQHEAADRGDTLLTRPATDAHVINFIQAPRPGFSFVADRDRHFEPFVGSKIGVDAVLVSDDRSRATLVMIDADS